MRVRFVSKGVPVITGDWLMRLLPRGKVNEGKVTLEVEVRGNEVRVNKFSFSKALLEEAIEGMGNTVHAVLPEGFMPLVKRGEHFYKLRGLEVPGPPTLEIDGVHMHRIAGTDPWRDTISKIKYLKIKKGDKVLDTCMGLGYTAIASLRRGAEVITVEKDENVLELATWNPWSWELERVEVHLDDVFYFIRELKDESVDKVVHDPPVITMAGKLYSLEFYKELFRVLKPGGRLFHYTGSPKRRSGVDLARGVMERLREAGFEVKRYPEALGVVAYKP